MTWSYAYTTTIWPSLITVLFLLAMVLFSARRLSVPGALPFMIAVLFSTAWAAGSVMEYAAVDLETKIFWIRFQTTWQIPAATTVTCFVLEYSWPGRWLTRRNLILLSIVPLLVFGLIWSNNQHHLMWHSFTLEGTRVTPLLSPGSWMAILYSFGLVIFSLAVLTWLFLHSPQHRWPVVIMVTGHIVVRTTFVLEKANLVSSTLPFDVLGLAFMAVMYTIALFGFRMLDPIPLARQTAIEQLHDGMLVLDLQGRVASLNSAAERIFRAERKHIQGMPIGQLLPMLPELSSASAIPTVLTKTVEMKTVPEAGTSDYELDFFPLNDFRGLPVGHLLLLHDVTQRKQAEAALNKSQEIQRLIFEKSFDGISIYEELPDKDQRILVDCNERYCQMAGRSKAELLAIQDTRVIQHSENLQEEADRVAVMAEQAFFGVFSWIRPDGKENIIEYNAAPIRVGERFFTIGVDRDVTESRQTQAQILEQQRALATLNERERLARELHDELAQDLALVNLQAQLVSGLLEAGQEEKAQAQLQVLARAARAAQVDVRGEIGTLSHCVDPVEGFWGSLRHFTETFQEMYGIEIELALPEDLRRVSLAPTAEVQSLRIVQEAFANIRKHAGAKLVRVSITKELDCMIFRIEDDGVGFDPARLPVSQRSFGLGIMAQRAAEAGGRVEVKSAPGKGTSVIIEIPVHEEA